MVIDTLLGECRLGCTLFCALLTPRGTFREASDRRFVESYSQDMSDAMLFPLHAARHTSPGMKDPTKPLITYAMPNQGERRLRA